MQEMKKLNVGHLRNDMKFIEQGIDITNQTKKASALTYIESEKRPKKQKNLKYFLKKKRDIYFKSAPSLLFTRSQFNRTRLVTGGK
jgi:hypothetical protein